MISGKVCAVTGGASGIGLALVEKLIEGNAKVVYVLDLNEKAGLEATEKFNEKYGEDRARFLRCNVADEQNVNDVFNTIQKDFNSLDIFCNNAGTCFPEIAYKVNLLGATNCCMKAVDIMSTANNGNGGIIINTASITGLVGCEACPKYSVSKHGVIGLTKSLGYEHFYQETNVKIMAICPGATDTTLLQTSLNFNPSFAEELEREHKASIQSPEEVANCMLLALSEGGPGSIFISENGENYEIEIPPYSQMRKVKAE